MNKSHQILAECLSASNQFIIIIAMIILDIFDNYHHNYRIVGQPMLPHFCFSNSPQVIFYMCRLNILIIIIIFVVIIIIIIVVVIIIVIIIR